jgi:hypothetical protein
MALLDGENSDFGPTYASEYLNEHHDITISEETCRLWMIKSGLWQPKDCSGRHRKKRPRRESIGQLVQMDTSTHDWLEGRNGAEKLCLISTIDDASSILTARLYKTDSTETNMDLQKRYVLKFGRPVAFYFDRASHFKVNNETKKSEFDFCENGSKTQIQRALEELNIAYIFAHSPQAKGRVERSYGTLQDRLPKDLRVHKINDIDSANEFLNYFIEQKWSKKFAIKPIAEFDAHRPYYGYDLDAIFSIQVVRTVKNDFTFKISNQEYQIEKRSMKPGLKKAKVLIELRLDGTLRARYKSEYLALTPIFSGNVLSYVKTFLPQLLTTSISVESPKSLQLWLKDAF